MIQTRSRVHTITLCALFAALMGICSQLQIPLPFVPINLALFAAHLAGALLGHKWGSASILVYVALGLIGVPFFAGFQSGFGTLFGKTGGYILGYILDAFLVGLLVKWSEHSYGKRCISMAIGTLACYAFGTVWFMLVTGMGLALSLSYCVLPFLPGDFVKILLAALLSRSLYRPLSQILAR